MKDSRKVKMRAQQASVMEKREGRNLGGVWEEEVEKERESG